MSEQPLVSVVTPSLNQGKFIRQTIESVLTQNYPNLEHWVIDGGSKDETLKILGAYEDRLHWISEPDRGQSQAVNKGWRQARGEILGWVNADDLLYPDAVRVAVEALLANPQLGGVYGDCVYVDEGNHILGKYAVHPYNFETLVCETENFIPQPSVFLRRSAVERVGLLDETLHYVMDFDLWLRMGIYFPLQYLPVEMAALRLHQGAKTLRATPAFADEFAQIFQRLFFHPDLPASLREKRRQILALAYIHAAAFHFWAGETRAALRYLRRSWQERLFPTQRTFYLLLGFSVLGKAGWQMAEKIHGNPYRLEKGWLR